MRVEYKNAYRAIYIYTRTYITIHIHNFVKFLA